MTIIQGLQLFLLATISLLTGKALFHIWNKKYRSK